MSEEFDPYYKWLAIPPKDQPPNHYRLLALEIFESDADVIASAADQRMAHVKAFQSGDHSDASQKLLNELSVARACLLKSDTKQDYDAALRRELGIAEPVDDDAEEESDAPGAFPVLGDDAKKSDSSAAISDVMIQTGDAGGGSTGGTSTAEKPAAKKAPQRDAKRDFKIKLIGHIVAPIVGLSLGALILLLIRPDVFGGKKKNTPPPPRVTIKNNNDKPPPKKIIVKPPPKKIIKPPPDLPDIPDVTTTGSDIQLPPPPPKKLTPPPPPILTPEQQIKKAEEKRDKALADGKIDEALGAAKQIAELRQQDALPIQVEMLSAFGKSASSPEQVRKFAKSSFKVIDKAIEDDKKDVVKQLAIDVLGAILKIGDTDLQVEATNRILAIQGSG